MTEKKWFIFNYHNSDKVKWYRIGRLTLHARKCRDEEKMGRCIKLKGWYIKIFRQPRILRLGHGLTIPSSYTTDHVDRIYQIIDMYDQDIHCEPDLSIKLN